MNGLFTATGLFRNGQLALLIHMKQRFDLQCSPHNSGGRGYTSTMFQMIEHIHRKPVAYLLAMLHNSVLKFQNGTPLCLSACCLLHQNSFAQRSAQGIDTKDRSVGIFLLQLVQAKPGRLNGAGHSGGKHKYSISFPLCRQGSKYER